MIKIKLGLSGSAPTQDIIGIELDLPVPLAVGDKIRHENPNIHLNYVVESVQFVIDDCKDSQDDGDESTPRKIFQSALVVVEPT